MTITSQGLLLSGLVDVRHRFLRLLAGIDEATSSADRGARAVLRAHRAKSVEYLVEHSESVTLGLLGARAAHGEDPSKWSDLDRKGLASVAVNGFHLLVGRHNELYRHIPGTRSTREDLGYLLYRALDLSLMSPAHAGLISVHTSDTLTWETTSFAGSVGERTAAVAVPWLETLGPLRWPLVGHELGHYFLPNGVDGHVRITQLSAENNWNRDAFEEIVADAVAQRHFGDAYAFALAREGYLLSYSGHVNDGVSVHKRLELLGSPADLIDAIPAEWNLSLREQLEASTIPAVSADQALAMRNNALNLVGAMKVNNAEAVTQARYLLRNDEPAAGVRVVDNLALVDAALHLHREKPKENVTHVIELAEHRPLTDGEIYEAAWREEVEKSNEAFLFVLDGSTDEDSLVSEAEKVVARDTWLARSLQSAAVHRWLNSTIEIVEMSSSDDRRYR